MRFAEELALEPLERVSFGVMGMEFPETAREG
jgi:hypothetical protein